MSYCKLRRNVGSGSGTSAPNNPALAAENNKLFDGMMAERARQDALLFGGCGQQQTQPIQPPPLAQQQPQQQQPKPK